MGFRIVDKTFSGPAGARPAAPAPTEELISIAGKQVVIIFNPTSGRRRTDLAAVVKELRNAGAEVAVRTTAACGDAERIAARCCSDGVDVVVAAGGDGTINEVVNGLLSFTLHERLPVLGIVPLGTANVLANELGLPAKPDRASEVLTRGRVRPIRVGIANGRAFCLMIGVGFDARVVAGVSSRLKRRIGKAAYLWSAARELAAGCDVRYRVEVDGSSYNAFSVIVAKARRYGGPFVCAPAARLDHSSLHVCLFLRGGRRFVLLYGFALVAGLLPYMPGYRVVAASNVTISGFDWDAVQVDGDVLTRLPVSAGLSDRALCVLAPPS